MHGRQLACQPGWGRLSEWGRVGGLGQGWEGTSLREVPDSALLKTGQEQELCVRLPLPFFWYLR